MKDKENGSACSPQKDPYLKYLETPVCELAGEKESLEAHDKLIQFLNTEFDLYNKGGVMIARNQDGQQCVAMHETDLENAIINIFDVLAGAIAQQENITDFIIAERKVSEIIMKHLMQKYN